MTPVTRRTLLILVSILITIGASLLLEFLLTVRPDRPFGHTRMGRLTGWAALAAVLLVFGYPIRKRWGKNRRWSKGWFRVHMLAGVAAPSLALIHSGAHLHALVPNLALITLGIITISGIVAQALHYFVVRTLREERRELAEQGFDDQQIDSRLQSLAQREQVIRMWQYLHAPLTATFVVLLLFHIGGALYFAGW